MDSLAQRRQGPQEYEMCNRHQVPHFCLEITSLSENENLRNKLDVHNPAGVPLIVETGVFIKP